MRIFRDRYTGRDGQRVTARRWTIDFADHKQRRHRVAGFTSKRATQGLADNIEALVSCKVGGRRLDVELQRWLEGLPDTLMGKLVSWGLVDSQRAEARKLLSKHLKDWQENIEAGEKTLKHAQQSHYRAEKVVKGCGFKTITDIDAHKVKTWLKKMRDQGEVVVLKQKGADGKPVRRLRKISKTTSNHYLRAIKMFTRWLAKQQRVSIDPLECLSMIDVMERDLKKKRRPLTDEECSRLLWYVENAESYQGLSGPDRALVYEVAIMGGLRKTEIRTLEVRDVNPFNNTVTVQDHKTKNRQTRTVPLPEAVMEKIKQRVGHKTPIALVFAGVPDKTAEMLKEDLQGAEIPVSIDGQDADFHALRMTANRRMRQAGIPTKIRQAILGHKTAAMTEKIYDRVSLDEVMDAAKKVPTVPREKRQAKATGTDGRKSQGKVTSTASHSAKLCTKNGKELESTGKTTPQETKAKSPVTTPKTTISPQKQGSCSARPAGLEPATFGFEVRGLSELTDEKTGTYEICKKCPAIYSAILLQKCPELKAVVEAWKGLSEDTRRRIIEITSADQA